MAKDRATLFALWILTVSIALYSSSIRISWTLFSPKVQAGAAVLESAMLQPVNAPPIAPSIQPPAKLRILSHDPFIVHIENFLSEEERHYLINMSKQYLARSTVVHANGTQSESSERTSSTAYLPRYDGFVTSILERAAEFQGYTQIEDMDMQVTAYQKGQEYRPHYDWFLQEGLTQNRLSSFFAILESDCENCGTQFPNISVDWTKKKDQRLCRLVDCSQSVFTSKNIAGSALYWRNLDPNGKGRTDTMHAGLPLSSGSKIGLNICTNIAVNPS